MSERYQDEYKQETRSIFEFYAQIHVQQENQVRDKLLLVANENQPLLIDQAGNKLRLLDVPREVILELYVL